MKKFSVRLWIIYFLVIAAIAVAFSAAYIELSDNYLENQVGNSLVYMTRKVAVDINVQIDRDYEKFSTLMTDIENNIEEDNYVDRLIANQLIVRKNELSDITNIDNVIIGYVHSTQGYYIVQAENVAILYEFTDQHRNSPFYKQNLAIYKLSTATDYDLDDTNYIFFRYRDVFFAFDAIDYLDQRLNNVENLPDNYYMLIDKAGNICYQKDADSRKNKLYNDYIKFGNTSTSYEYLRDDLINNKTGYQMYRIFGKNSFFTYTPIVQDLASEGLFVSYIFERSLAIESNAYLTKLMIAVFISIFVIIAIGLALGIIVSVRKAEDIRASKFTYLFTKSYALQINKKGKIKFFNGTCRKQFKDIKQYKTVYDFTPYKIDDDIMNSIILLKGITIQIDTIKNNEIYIHFIPIKSFSNYYLLGEDVSDSVRENDKNRRIALFNPVTNLPNRNLLDRALDDILSSSSIVPSKKSLICLNVLDFPKINRIFGFYFADRMLREVADIVKSSLGKYDATLYNIRTSIFMVLFNELDDYQDVFKWANSVIEKLSEPIDITDDYLTTIEVNIGIFNIEPEKYGTLTAKNIYDYAYAALERVQNSRQLKCAVYNNEVSQTMTREQAIEKDLREAIAKHEFMMHFQPQYNTKDKRISGFEALLRCKNPKLKLESPELYITIAEKNGMIVEIGKIIITETFAFAKRIEPYNVHISMNVSPVQLLQSGFTNELISVFKSYDLKPHSIAIEITETFLMENSHVMIDKLRLLKECGFDVHLDDFGIGYSSMLYLKDLPIDTIKIDKEFTKHMLTDKFSRVIVSKIIQIALSLNLGIIAEGVENEKQSIFLSKTGCDIIQGYLMSPAVDEKEAIKFIDKYNVKGEILIKESNKRKTKKDSFVLDDAIDIEPDVIVNDKDIKEKKDKKGDEE